jgi:hypothetical protein
VYFTYIIIITNAKCVKTKIETRRIKYIKYNYITNSDTTWNHGEVAWENSWEKENNELANEPLFIVEYFTNSTPNTCDQMIQNQNIYINASFFGFMKIFYQEYLRKENFITEFENIEDSIYNIIFLLLSIFMNVGYKESKKMEIATLRGDKNNDISYLNQYMKIKKNSMTLFLIACYIFIKNVGIAE